jgi:dipeptidyl-peptidase-4
MLVPLSKGWQPKNENENENGNEKKDFYFIWASERSGYRQLYLYKISNNKNVISVECLLDKMPIGGGGSWIVDGIEGINEKKEIIYFSCNKGKYTWILCISIYIWLYE